MKTIICVGFYCTMALLATADEPILLLNSDNMTDKIEYLRVRPDYSEDMHEIPIFEEKIPALSPENKTCDCDCDCEDDEDEDDNTTNTANQEIEAVREPANPIFEMDINTGGSKVQGDTEIRKTIDHVVKAQASGLQMPSVNPKSGANRGGSPTNENFSASSSNIEVPNRDYFQATKPLNYPGSSDREAAEFKNYVGKGKLVISGSYKYTFHESGDEVEYHYVRKYDKRPMLTGEEKRK